MNIKLLIHILSSLLVLTSLTMLAPLGISFLYQDGNWRVWIITIVAGLISGVTAWVLTKSSDEELTHREGFAVVGLGWILFAAYGAVPYCLAGVLPNYIDAFFETMSGFTTTGATVITAIGELPHDILFWRSLTHWLGGMGIIVLSIAILPLLGVGGMQLYKAEMPGPSKDRLTPRIASTAKLLWGVYLTLSFLEVVMLWAGGMPPFEAVCHTFGTMATGGFSTKDASIGYYNSPYFEGVITLFMFLAGVSFALHYRALKGNLAGYFRDREFLFYAGIAITSIVLVVLTLLPRYESISVAFRHASFQVVSILTTTGYCVADFDQWPRFAKALLFLLMFVGGCAGSTGGGMKQVRILLLIKYVFLEIKKLVHPQGAFSLKLGDKSVSPEIMGHIEGFFLLYLGLFLIASAAMLFLVRDTATAVSSVVATLGNIGPGFSLVGASQNYAHIPQTGKVILSLCMVFGRLEIYTILVLFMPSLWRR